MQNNSKKEMEALDNIKIQELRIKLGMSQSDLAKAAGVSLQTIHRIESGKNQEPRPRDNSSLAKALLSSRADRLLVYLLFSTVSFHSSTTFIICSGVRFSAERSLARYSQGPFFCARIKSIISGGNSLMTSSYQLLNRYIIII